MNHPFLSDSYFSIGSTHRVCEDYAQHGIGADGPLGYGIISDGCSSARKTDFGARLLSQAALHYLPHGILFADKWDSKEHAEGFGQDILHRATSARMSLGLPPESLYATLGAVFARPGMNLTAYLLGDGVIAAKTSCGHLSFIQVEYPKEAPFYLQYEADPGAKQAFLDEYGGLYKWTSFIKNHAGKWEKLDSAEREINTDIIPFEIMEYPTVNYDFVAVLSDGVDKVHRTVKTATSKTTEQVPTTEVVEELLNFKPHAKPNFNGNFVERRFKRVFRDHPDWQHLDDLSVAVVAKGASNGQEETT